MGGIIVQQARSFLAVSFVMMVLLSSTLVFAGQAWAGEDGTQKWAFTTGTEIESTPAIGADGIIYYGSGDGKLYAIYEQLWWTGFNPMADVPS